ncbi:hypothetical protein J8I29_14675 [Labrys sp. LIt4]|uniref:hypothetical protein n=1 Tax=Labrys sp. LIt4 TaxID=2821355 RepID=UPI001AE09EDB|nr:hypothetical protein [Labrys sp. LIt4]MBP0580566.1 hypothetical protein [Labrys sp. LIt4]
MNRRDLSNMCCRRPAEDANNQNIIGYWAFKMRNPPKLDPELLRACYLSGQMTEAQWQEHIANGDVEELAGAKDDGASISPLEAAMILGKEAMLVRARQFMDKHPELSVGDLMVEFALLEAELLMASKNRAA